MHESHNKIDIQVKDFGIFVPDKKKLEEKIEELQKEYSKTKYNKATNKYLGILRAKIAAAKRKISSQKRRKGTGFLIKKSGDATVALVGFPNAGKSLLLSNITDVESKVAAYAFTTVDLIPATLRYKGASIQMFDLPGLIEGAHIGRGGGAQIASAIRVSDLLLFVVDSNAHYNLYTLLEELGDLGIKAGKKKPKILIEKTKGGGVLIEAQRRRTPDKRTVTKILNEFGVFNCKVIFMEDAGEDELIDAISENNVYIDAIVALNKIDLSKNYNEVMKEIIEKTGLKVIPISALQHTNLEALKEIIFEELKLNRIYLKPKEGEPDFEKPVIVREGSNVYDAAIKIHSSIAENLKYAYVTGKSVKFKNQKVGKEHKLADEDVVTLVYQNV